jgi:hypothetical protein
MQGIKEVGRSMQEKLPLLQCKKTAKMVDILIAVAINL